MTSLKLFYDHRVIVRFFFKLAIGIFYICL